MNRRGVIMAAAVGTSLIVGGLGHFGLSSQPQSILFNLYLLVLTSLLMVLSALRSWQG